MPFFPLFLLRPQAVPGACLGGIALDPVWAGGRITAWSSSFFVGRRMLSRALTPIVLAVGRRWFDARRGRAGRCERALLSIALDAGRRCAGRRGGALSL